MTESDYDDDDDENSTDCNDSRNNNSGFARLMNKHSRALANRKQVVQWIVLKVLDLCQGFAGGVLLAAGLLHLLPESIEDLTRCLEILFPHDHDHDHLKASSSSSSSSFVSSIFGHDHDHDHAWYMEFPWALACMCIALFSLIFLEDVLVELFSGFGHSHHGHGHGHSHDHDHHEEEDVNIPVLKNSSSAAASYGGVGNNSTAAAAASDSDNAPRFLYQITAQEDMNARKRIKKNKQCSGDHEEGVAHNHGHKEKGAGGAGSNKPLKSFISGLVLWLSLSVHSATEGLALGTGGDDGKMWSIFIAIVSHKLVEAFSLGAVLNEAFAGTRTVLLFFLVLVFSLATPAGIAIGIVVSSIDNVYFYLITAILMAFAAGAFVHVCLEILRGHDHGMGISMQHFTKKQKQRMEYWNRVILISKYLLFAVGWVFMAVLASTHHH